MALGEETFCRALRRGQEQVGCVESSERTLLRMAFPTMVRSEDSTHPITDVPRSEELMSGV